MSYFEFPHTRTYEGDLGYILKQLTQLTEDYNTFFKYNTIKFADPIEWDITKQYPAFMIVFDTDNMCSFISKQPVPSGITLDNQDYWSFVGPLIVDGDARMEIERILQFVTNIYDPSDTATAVRAVGDFLITGGDLYLVTAPINVGDHYTVGFNIDKTTIEDMIVALWPPVDNALDTSSTNAIANKPVAEKFNSVDGTVSTLSNTVSLVSSQVTNLNNRVNTTVAELDNTQADLAAETSARIAADQTLDNRITAIGTLPSGSTAGDAELMDIRTGADGITYSNAGNAVRGQVKGLTTSTKAIGWEQIDYYDGHYIPTNANPMDINNPVVSAGWRCAKIACSEGDVFLLSGKGQANPGFWIFVKADGTKVQGTPNPDAQHTNELVYAPHDAEFLILNDYPKVDDSFKGIAPVIAEEKGTNEKNIIRAISERIDFCDGGNLYDYHSAHVGHIQPSNGAINISVINNYHYCDTFAPVTAGETLYSNLNPIVNWYNAAKGWISGGSFSGNAVTVPSGAYFARFSADAADQSTVIVNRGSSLDPDAKPYEIVIDGIKAKQTVIVDASGRGHYTSLTKALYESDADIVVYAGTYDVVSEYQSLFGASIFNNISDSYSGIGQFKYGPYYHDRKVSFMPGSSVVCDLTGVLTVDATHRFAPVNLGPNSEIDGMHLTATKTWYVVHDDFGDTRNYVNKITNCVLIGVSLINANVIGGGTRSHSTNIVENCYMDNGQGSSTETMRYHNYNAADAAPVVIVKNNRVNGSIGARYYGAQSTPHMTFICNNNSTGSGVIKSAEGGATIDNVDLYEWANVIE